MRRAFTLVEMMIVVTTMAILMSMVFRLGNITSDVSRRDLTINRLQRLENALAGYYAAYGTYPPVTYHNTPNIYASVSSDGVQTTQGGENKDLWGWLGTDNKVKNASREASAWNQVKAACEAQPVGCNFPLEDSESIRKAVEKYSERMKKYVSEKKGIPEETKRIFQAGFDTGTPTARFSGYEDVTDWRELQLFRFGVMSYLLPRYLFMMSGPAEFLDFQQWMDNNQYPCDVRTGERYTSWADLRKEVEQKGQKKTSGTGVNFANAISSQSVCARWIANFEKSLSTVESTPHVFYDVDVMSRREEDADYAHWWDMSAREPNLDLEVYAPGSSQNNSGQYILNAITIMDGWGTEFYYHSPAPYQSYVVWSAGPNKRTFPPWVDRAKLDGDANRCIGYWTEDDLVGLRK